MRLHGLAPIAGKEARVLILGSFPSEASLRAQRYYAHPRNQFWAVVEALFGVARDDSYARRCRQLAARGVAVWDVIGRCRRRGSLDSAIRQPEANDFAAFYRDHPRIAAVFFNGAEAERQYRRLVTAAPAGARGGAVAGARLPSTSPANAGVSLAGKIEKWRAVLDAAEAMG